MEHMLYLTIPNHSRKLVTHVPPSKPTARHTRRAECAPFLLAHESPARPLSMIARVHVSDLHPPVFHLRRIHFYGGFRVPSPCALLHLSIDPIYNYVSSAVISHRNKNRPPQPLPHAHGEHSRK